MAEKIARQIMSFDPAGMDGMTLVELTDIVEHELRDRDGLAYCVLRKRVRQHGQYGFE